MTTHTIKSLRELSSSKTQRHSHDIKTTSSCLHAACTHIATSLSTCFCYSSVSFQRSLSTSQWTGQSCLRNSTVVHTKSKRKKAHIVHPVASISDELHPPLVAPVVAVATATDLPTPGETHTVLLHFTVLRYLMRSQSRNFALSASNVSTTQSTTIATLHTVQHVPPPSTDTPIDVLAVACSCEARAQLTRLPPDDNRSMDAEPKYFFVANVAPIHDIPVSTYTGRQQLARAEWGLWENVSEVFALASKLSPAAGKDFVPWVESDIQRIHVFAPREYDNDVSEKEWDLTPQGNRNMWSRRAEAFSFAVLRAMQPSDEEMSGAFAELSTERRILIVQLRVLQAKNRIVAALGISDVFNTSK